MSDGTTLDLTPRTVEAPKRRRGLGAAVVVLLVIAATFVLWKGLSDATLFFYNADEAVAQRTELSDDRFRLQGTVVPGTLVEQSTGVEFDVQYDGVAVSVVHTGAPPELFQEGMPVVLEGQWEGDVYGSDVILVKHDEVYEEDNGERLDDAESGGVTADTDERDEGGAGYP